MSPKLPLLSSAAIVGACLVHFVLASQAAQASFWVFGASAIATGETARLNVVTVGIRESLPAQLIFFDSNGGVLMQSMVELAPGRVVSLDLPFIERSAIGNRVTYYPMVRLLSKPSGDGYVVPSLEVIDAATGRTIRAFPNPEG
jgi:hypothetical protein